MMMKKTVMVMSLGLLGLVAGPSVASSSDAWDSHTKEVTEKCIAASELKDAKPVGQLVLFDDSVGFDALVIKGTMNKQPTIKLCLFNKSKRIASVGDADFLM